MTSRDFERFRVGGQDNDPRSASAHAQHARRRGRFLKGPVSWAWLAKAGRLPGRSLQLAVVIWLLHGMNRSASVRLGGRYQREIGLDRHASYRALRQLEAAGLITADRSRGRNPIVTILDVEEVPIDA